MINPAAVVWGRCVAEAVGYPAKEARPLGLAWAVLQHQDVQPPGGCEIIVFAGHHVGISDEDDFVVRVGRRRCDDAAYYRSVRALGPRHEALVAEYHETLEPVADTQLVSLDTRRLAARLWREQ